MFLGGYYHATILSPCIYARPVYGKNGLNDSEYWRHDDGARHLATQLMNKYSNLSVYGFQSIHTIQEDAWTDVDRLNACFFAQASRIILFVPSEGEEMIKYFSRTCLTPLLTRPRASGGRPDWHSRFIAAAIGSVRIPNQLSQDVPFIKVIRFREVGWMRDITAMTLLHRAIRDFWTPFSECKSDRSRWSLSSTSRAEYSLTEIIETTAWIGTQTSVTGRIEADGEVSESSEVTDTLQPSEPRFRSRTRSGMSRSRSRSGQTNSSGYRSLDPDFEAFQADERLLDTRVILSVLSSSQVVPLYETKLNDQKARTNVNPLPGKLISSALVNGLSENTSRKDSVKDRETNEDDKVHPSQETRNDSSDSLEPNMCHDSARSTEPLQVGALCDSHMEGTVPPVEQQTHKDFGLVVDSYQLNHKLSGFTPPSERIVQFGHAGVDESLQTIPLESETSEDKNDLLNIVYAQVDKLKVTSEILTPNSDGLIVKQGPEVNVPVMLRVDELKTGIVMRSPLVEAFSSVISKPTLINTQQQYDRPENETDLIVNRTLLSSIPFIDASSHLEWNDKAESGYENTGHSISTTQSLSPPPPPSPQVFSTAMDTRSSLRKSKEKDTIDSAYNHTELNHSGRRYPRVIKIIRRSNTTALQLNDDKTEQRTQRSQPIQVTCLNKSNSGDMFMPISPSTSEHSVPVTSASEVQTKNAPQGTEECPKLTKHCDLQTQATTQSETQLTDKTVSKSDTVFYKKTITRKEFISESTIFEKQTKPITSEEMYQDSTLGKLSHKPVPEGESELNTTTSRDAVDSCGPPVPSHALKGTSHPGVFRSTERSQRLGRRFHVKETHLDKQNFNHETVMFQDKMNPCLANHIPLEMMTTTAEESKTPCSSEPSVRPEQKTYPLPFHHTVERAPANAGKQVRMPADQYPKRQGVQPNGSAATLLNEDENPKSPLLHRKKAVPTSLESTEIFSLHLDRAGGRVAESLTKGHRGNEENMQNGTEEPVMRPITCMEPRHQVDCEPNQTASGWKIAGINWHIVGAYSLVCLTVLLSAVVAYFSIYYDRNSSSTSGGFWRWLCSVASQRVPKWFDQD